MIKQRLNTDNNLHLEPQQIRVGIFSSSSLEFYGGGEFIIIELANSLARRGYHVTVYSDLNYRNVSRISSSSVDEKLLCKHQRVPYFCEKSFLMPHFLYQPLPAYDSICQNDINLIMLYRLPSSRYFKEVILRSDKAIVFMMHGVVLNQIRNKSPKVMAYQIFVKFLFSLRSRLYVTSGNVHFQVFDDRTKRLMLRNNVEQKNVYIIPNGIDFSRYFVGRNDERFKIIFIGRLNKLHKGVPFLIKVIQLVLKKHLQDLEFCIVGSGPEAKKIMKTFSKYDSVKYLGFISEEEKIKNLSTSNLMIITSNIEPFPIVAIEALASGLPIVSTRASGPQAMLSTADDLGKVVGFKTDSFVTAVVDYHSIWRRNKGEYYVRKIGIRKKSEVIFSLDKMTDNYASMIMKIHRDIEDKKP